MKIPRILTIVLALIIGFNFVRAEEGMWTFDNLPLKDLKEKYGFTPDSKWIDHVRLSSIRVNDGGSASFVSPKGLVMTNHHVAVMQLQKLSSADNNIVDNGFYASDYSDELKCPDLELNVLISMENITDKVKSVVKSNMSETEKLEARKKVINEIEKESKEKTGLRSDVVNLYRGGEYWLYRYKKYTDIRLVFAPERQAAYFGGDYDNFTYPRFNLDVTFFRVWEDDKPLKSQNYFKWNTKGPAENELVFISGNPGSTNRLYTHAQLEFQRDVTYPFMLNMFNSRIAALDEYAELGEEQARRAVIRKMMYSNSLKALTGTLEGLRNPKLMEIHKSREGEFRKAIQSNPEWNKKYGSVFDEIEKITKESFEPSMKRSYRSLNGSSLAGKAHQIVQYVDEIEKPDSERENGFHDTELEGFKFRMFSNAPVYKDLEIVMLTGDLENALANLGKDDDFNKYVLNGKSPRAAAEYLINNTQLDDVDYRKKLIEGGKAAVSESKDPMIQLLIKLDPMFREASKWYEENVSSKMSPLSQLIAEARFDVFGKSSYPDATFTPRLTYGSAVGYEMNGTIAPYMNTMYGLFDRAIAFGNKGDFKLPEKYFENYEKIDLKTPCNFVCTCDIIGGNSGSPVFNKNAEVIGIVFDGNIESLPGRFVYDIEKNRAVVVHSAYIIEALRKIFDAEKLADEIEGK